MKRGKLPDGTPVEVKGTPKEDANDDDPFKGQGLPAALHKLLTDGYVVRHTQRHKFECGGEEKLVIVLVLTQD
jgi:hypothetical protein